MVGRQHFSLDPLAKSCRGSVLDHRGGGLEGLPGDLGAGGGCALDKRTPRDIGQQFNVKCKPIAIDGIVMCLDGENVFPLLQERNERI